MKNFVRFSFMLLFFLSSGIQGIASNSDGLMAADYGSSFLAPKVYFWAESDCKEVTITISDDSSSGAVNDICNSVTPVSATFANSSTGQILTVSIPATCNAAGDIVFTAGASIFQDGNWTITDISHPELPPNEPATCHPQQSCSFSIYNTFELSPVVTVTETICPYSTAFAFVNFYGDDSNVTINSWRIDGVPFCLNNCSTLVQLPGLSIGTHTLCIKYSRSYGDCIKEFSFCQDIEVLDCACIFEVITDCDFCGNTSYTVVDGFGDPVGLDTEVEWFLEVDGSYVSVSTDNPFTDNSGSVGHVFVSNRRCDCEHYIPFEPLKDCDNCKIIDELDGTEFSYTFECNEDGATFTAYYLDGELPECGQIKWDINGETYYSNPVSVSSPDGQYYGSFVITFEGANGKKCAAGFDFKESCCEITAPINLHCGTLPNNGLHFIGWSEVPGAVSYIVQIIFNDPDCCKKGENVYAIQINTENHYLLTSQFLGGRKQCYSFKVRAKCRSGELGPFSEKFCSKDCSFGPPDGKSTEKRSSGFASTEWYVVNPLIQFIQIENLKTDHEYFVSVLSSDGKIMRQDKVTNSYQHKINIADAASGIYMLKVVDLTDNSSRIEKLVKN